MAKVFYGEETKKAVENFRISGQRVDLELFHSLFQVKLACARANFAIGRLPQEIAVAIIQACEEGIQHRFDDQFVTDAIQGGAGTSINMNSNEVIATRASEIAGVPVHSLDHVNLGQSTNDVIPTALKVTLLRLIPHYLETLKELQGAFEEKSREFWDVVKVGRTHLQDAVPVRLGQEFKAYATFVARDRARLTRLLPELRVTNLGATSIGTAINTTKAYIENAHNFLSAILFEEVKPAEDLIDATQNLDTFLEVSSMLKVSAVGLCKIMNDIRLMASGPRAGLHELILPEMQKGSSIMPGKVNPVIPEVVNQIAFKVIGNDTTATMVMSAGQFELNVMLPVFINDTIQSLKILTNGVKTLTHKAILGLKADKEQCEKTLEHSLAMATGLNSHIGYDKTAYLVKKAFTEGKSLRAVLKEENLLPEETLNEVLEPKTLTEPK
ncbi:MAG: aspartate ammonia-lyase [bacterium]